MRILATLLLVLVIAAAGLVGVVYSGVYNVAASDPHERWVTWLLDTTAANSIRRHARTVQVPPWSEEDVLAGALHHRAKCVQCHGAPGIERGEIGQGLQPRPPQLSKAATEWLPRELFWIVKHGIKLTGMPAFGLSLPDREIWQIVAFLQRLPGLTPQHYQAITQPPPPQQAEAPAPEPPRRRVPPPKPR